MAKKQGLNNLRSITADTSRRVLVGQLGENYVVIETNAAYVDKVTNAKSWGPTKRVVLSYEELGEITAYVLQRATKGDSK